MAGKVYEFRFIVTNLHGKAILKQMVEDKELMSRKMSLPGSRVVGFWQTELTNNIEVVEIVEYDSLGHLVEAHRQGPVDPAYNKRTELLMKQQLAIENALTILAPGTQLNSSLLPSKSSRGSGYKMYPAYNKRTELLMKQQLAIENALTILAPGTQLKSSLLPSESSTVYELQTTEAKACVPSRLSSALVGHFVTLYGPLNTGFMLYRHQSPKEAQEAAMERLNDENVSRNLSKSRLMLPMSIPPN